MIGMQSGLVFVCFLSFVLNLRQCLPVSGFMAPPVTVYRANPLLFSGRVYEQQDVSLLVVSRQQLQSKCCQPRVVPTRRQVLMSASARDASGVEVVKGLMVSLFCIASFLGGPGVFRVAHEVATATGLSMHPPSADAMTDEQYVLNEAWRTVNAAYVDPSFNGQDWKAIRLKALKKEYKNRDEVYSSAKAMLKALGDPYTRFLTPQEYDAITGMARGGAAGVGIELAASPPTPSKGSVVVVGGVAPGSPAEKAGVKTGDSLVAVDGEEATGTNLDGIVGMLRGDPGSRVRLDVKRDGKSLVFPVTRGQFKYVGVRSETKTVGGGRKVGVLTVKLFSKDTAEDVSAAMEKLAGEGAESVVLDLRHNPGGFFPGGIDVAREYGMHPSELPTLMKRLSLRRG